MRQFSMFGAVLGIFLLGGWAFGQRDFSAVEVVTTPVRGSVFMLEGSGGNIGVCAGEDGVLMIDDQFAPLADKILGAVRKLGHGDPKFLVNTHHHGDHVGGNRIFGESATIFAHDNVRKRLSTVQRNSRGTTRPSPKAALPVVTFADSLSFHFNGEEIRVLHLPQGHTDGDCAVYFSASNVAHLGDHFFAGRFPFVDLESGGDVLGLATNIGKVLEWLPEDAKIIPGHGPLSSREDLESYHRMLVDTTDAVKAGIAEGKSLDEIQKAGVASQWKSWGTGFIDEDRWLQMVYTSLTR